MPGGASDLGTQGVSVADVGTRSRWRDTAVLAALALLLVAGLVYYGHGMTDEPSASPGPSSTSPSPRAQARLDSAPPADPTAPAPPAQGTCWDGRPTTSLSLCGLPAGARGLSWVFPSFAEDRPLCHRAAPRTDSYPVVESFECFQRSLGQPVTITYDLVDDVEQVESWLLQRLGEQSMREVPGAHGGRCIFRDGDASPARITAMYEKFPYVVSVYATSPQAAAGAWRKIVRQRPPQYVRGLPA
jgi:hypothetical protein